MVLRAAHVTGLGLALLVLLAAAPAAAQPAGTSSETEDADRAVRSPWSLTFSATAFEGFQYQFFRGEGEESAVLTGRFDLDRARLNVTYTSELEDGEEPRRVHVALSVAGVYEFRDLNGNGRFELGDEIVRFHKIGEAYTAQLERLSMPGAVEGARASYRIGGGWLHLTVLTSPTLRFLGQRPIVPTDTELNLTLEDMETEEEGTMLGLALRASSQDIEQTGPRVLTMDGQRAKALYHWAQNATVDGQEAPVGETVLVQRLTDGASPRDEGVIVLATEPGSRIQHTASLEIAHTRTTLEAFLGTVKGDPLVFSFGGALAAALIGSTAWAKIRRGDDGSVRDV